MNVEIVNINEKKIVGKRLAMTIEDDKTRELWQSFMPLRNNIPNKVSDDLLCIKIYEANLNFNEFDLKTVFYKLAALEVSSYDKIPEGMEMLILKAGKYAKFHYIGNPNEFESTWRYIFFEWLPNSNYELDNSRPHFDLIGAKYKNNQADSEEDIFIPIKLKAI